MQQNDPSNSRNSSLKLPNKTTISSTTTTTTATSVSTAASRGGNASSCTTVITTASATTAQQHIIYNHHTISALIRGLHNTGIRDVNTMHLPLVDESGEETTALSSVTSALDHSNSTPNSLLATPRLKSEMSPHSSLPRLIINIEPANDAGGGGGVVGTPGSSLSPTDELELAKQNGTGLPFSPGARRFSQFNFALRRFSHVNNPAVVLGKSLKLNIF